MNGSFILKAAFLLALPSAASDEKCTETPGPARGSGFMQLQTFTATSGGTNRFVGRFGRASCPCIGIDNTSGTTLVVLHGTSKAEYPADVGAHCAAWDDNRELLSCKEGQDPGRGNGWCAQPWCFVDPCNCNLHSQPKASEYLPDGQYQGKPMYYSYATCGGNDTRKEVLETKAMVDQLHSLKADTSMCEKPASWDWGKEGCKCVGISGRDGEVNFTVGGKPLAFPAETGSRCRAWDLENNPACSRGNNASVPEWCAQQWCYVDPCSCSLAVPASQSSYLPDASSDGRSVYYSYNTCNDEDLWTTSDPYACANLKSAKICLEFPNCGWDPDKKECLDRQLLYSCKKAIAEAAKEAAADAAEQEAAANRSVTEAYEKLAAANSAMEKAMQVAKNASAARVASEAKARQENVSAVRAVNVFEHDLRAVKAAASNLSKKTIDAQRAENQSKAARAYAGQEKAAADRAESEHGRAKAAEKAAFSKAKEEKLKAERAVEQVVEARAAEIHTQEKAAEKHLEAGRVAQKFEEARDLEEAAHDDAIKKRNIAEAAKKLTEDFVPKYGSAECPCIGLDNITGTTLVVLDNSQTAEYPADVGAHCAAWDDGREPSSCTAEDQFPGRGKSWCAKRWCFVDPCNCNLLVKPISSSYLPNGQYQGKPLYYSHATCGGVDTWLKEEEAVSKGKEEKEILNMVGKDEPVCEKSAPDSADWGKGECKCVGISGLAGKINFTATAGGKQMVFPAEAGSKCNAWDFESNPTCSVGDGEVPSWCAKKWCFVDPCSCSLASAPKVSQYLRDANVDGRSIYYSYETCGADDVWTAENNQHACVNYESESACSAFEKCAWDAGKKQCLGIELVYDCKNPKIGSRDGVEVRVARPKSNASGEEERWLVTAVKSDNVIEIDMDPFGKEAWQQIPVGHGTTLKIRTPKPSLQMNIGNLVSTVLFTTVAAFIFRQELKTWPPVDPDANLAEVKDWSTGGMACFSDMPSCLCACCCLPVAWADNTDMVGYMKFWIAFAVVLFLRSACAWPEVSGVAYLAMVIIFTVFRRHLRRIFDMPGQDAGGLVCDFCFICCCVCCAIAQESRHIADASRAGHACIQRPMVGEAVQATAAAGGRGPVTSAPRPEATRS